MAPAQTLMLTLKIFAHKTCISVEIRVYQALCVLKSNKNTWRQRPIKTLQDKLQILGLDVTVFEEDPILFCIFKQRMFGKFRGNLKKYNHY